jgi:hypothetical protein
MTIRRGLDWILHLLTTYIRHSELQVISAIDDRHTLQFTVAHAVVFSVFTSRILTTDFNTLIILVSHTKSPFYSPTLATNSRLSLFNHLRLPPQEIPSIIPLLLSSYLGRLASRAWVWVLCYDQRSVGLSVLEKCTHLGLTTRFLLPSHHCGYVDVWRSLWRENGSVIYKYCWPSPAQSF